MKGASWVALSWQLISQMYRLHKVAYRKHVPPDRSTLLVIFMVYGYLTSPEAVWFLLSSLYLNITVRATSIWRGKVMAALWDEYPPLYDVHSIHIAKKKKSNVCKSLVHGKYTDTHTHKHSDTHSYIHTHIHTRIVTLGSGIMLKLSLRNSTMQYSLIAKQMSLSFMLKTHVVKSM